MKNHGQIERKVKYNKKEVKLSQYILNLSEEAKKWKQLKLSLKKRILKNERKQKQ